MREETTACNVSRERSRKGLSGSIDHIAASLPESNCAALSSLSATCCHSAASARCCLLAALRCAAPGFRALPRSTGAIASNARHLTLRTTTGPYPSRLLLPSLPITTTTNSPYRLHYHIHTSPPTLPALTLPATPSLPAPSLFRRDALAIIIHACRQLLAHAETSQSNCLPRHCLAA